MSNGLLYFPSASPTTKIDPTKPVTLTTFNEKVVLSTFQPKKKLVWDAEGKVILGIGIVVVVFLLFLLFLLLR